MVSLLTVSKAQKQLLQCMKAKRLRMGLTQAGLATRAGVTLPTLRKFEQKGLISLESFLKLLMVLDSLQSIVESLSPKEEAFASIDEVLEPTRKKTPKKGWHT